MSILSLDTSASSKCDECGAATSPSGKFCGECGAIQPTPATGVAMPSTEDASHDLASRLPRSVSVLAGVVIGAAVLTLVAAVLLFWTRHRDDSPTAREGSAQASASPFQSPTANEDNTATAPASEGTQAVADPGVKQPVHADNAGSVGIPVYSDQQIDVQRLDKKLTGYGCVLTARIHNKSSAAINTVIIHVNGYDYSGAVTENATFVFLDIPPFGDAVKDMTGSLRTTPATIKIVDVSYP